MANDSNNDLCPSCGFGPLHASESDDLGRCASCAAAGGPIFRLTTDARILSAMALAGEGDGALDQDLVQDALELDGPETSAALAKVMGSLRAQMRSFVAGGKVETALLELLGPDEFENLLRDLGGHLIQTLI